MRLLAHFAGGGMLETLKAHPTKDVHMIAAEIAGISRRVAKTLGFAVLYGAGVGRIAESLNVSVGEATGIKRRYLEALPEIKRYQKSLSELAACGEPVKTLGGRQYYTQPPAIVQGRLRTFEYKLTNYMIQGSAADQTKEAMYRYCTTTRAGQLVLSVHDQIVVQVPTDCIMEERKLLEEAVNGAFQEELNYQVISDEAIGNCFGALK
jgi:DNA polymerase-1